METTPRVIHRLTWICIRDYRMLFVQNTKRGVLVEPGVRWTPPNLKKGTLERETSPEELREQAALLAQKVERDLKVSLAGPVEFLDSFCSPAHEKEEGIMVEMRMFMSGGYHGEIPEDPSPGLRAHWLRYRDNRFRFSKATLWTRAWLRDQGIY